MQPKGDVHALGTIELVTGIVEDGRDLFAAHVEALREDLSIRLASLGSLLIAIGVFVVTALLASLAVAASLVAIGAPWWAALWAVTLAAAAIGLWFGLRARAKARTAGTGLASTVDRVRDDIALILSTPREPTMTRAIVRAGVIALAEAIVRRVAVALVDESPAARR